MEIRRQMPSLTHEQKRFNRWYGMGVHLTLGVYGKEKKRSVEG